MTVVEPITSSNSTSGAGVIDSWHQVAISADEIKNAHGADAAAIGVELGINVASAVLDTVAFALDPLAKLIAAGLGWLIEHISFLKKPLDWVAGDPAGVNKLAEELHTIAEDLRNAGKDLDSALTAQITQWQGSGYDSFKTRMEGHKAQVDEAGHSVDIAGYVVKTTGALVAAVRTLVRDMITTVLGDIIATMLVALATAIITFGASIVVGVTKCVITATVQVAAMMAKLAKVISFGGRVAKRLADLAKTGKGATPRPGSAHEMTPVPHTGGGTPHETPPATPHDTPNTPHDETPPASPHDETPPATPHDETPPASPHDETPPAGQHEDDPFDTWLAADNHFNPPHETPPATPHDTPNTPHDETPPASPHDETPPASPHDETPPASPHDETPPAHDETTPSGNTPHEETPPPANTNVPDPASALKPQEIAVLKKHENWLKGNFKDSWAKVKYVDDKLKAWSKKAAEDAAAGRPVNPAQLKAYEILKTMSDAKSTKNWAGWVGKDIVQVDRQMTDIQMQAEAAWNSSDEKWRAEHPDPAAQGQQPPPA
ncbi:hypothetical protein [Amycolatopsis sp. GM8]|uniref:hypothetical protein n=1 Tax=Amycolatopsis sp. GM8 TaxID=2896530 RepID=UPI001F3786C1|nr:hypothetical protein [Amycolatopsis sp. GM8]